MLLRVSLRAYNSCLPVCSIPVCGRPFPLLAWLRQPRRRRGGWKVRWDGGKGRGTLWGQRWVHWGLRGDCDSGTALRLSHSRRKTILGIYSIIILFCYIFRRSFSLASYFNKSFTFLSIFITRLGGGKSLYIYFIIIFFFTPGFFRNSIRYID